MPPAAATECERTGGTLLMIATLAPVSAAARAARCPARPAPIIKTSCAGMAPWGVRRRLRDGLSPGDSITRALRTARHRPAGAAGAVRRARPRGPGGVYA